MSTTSPIPTRSLHWAARALLLAGLGLPLGAIQVEQRPALGAPLEPSRQAPVPGAKAPPIPVPAPLEQRPPAPGWSRLQRGGETLLEVRALFTRLDVDGNGRLDLRQADHGAVDALQFARGDVDADGALDFDEFCVARQRAQALLGRPQAPDLIAASTRIQALWRARAAQLERQAAREVRGVSVGPSGRSPALSRLPPPVGAPPAGAQAPPGPAQARLSAAVDSSAALTAERARRAQILLEVRRREREPAPEVEPAPQPERPPAPAPARPAEQPPGKPSGRDAH